MWASYGLPPTRLSGPLRVPAATVASPNGEIASRLDSYQESVSQPNTACSRRRAEGYWRAPRLKPGRWTDQDSFQTGGA